MTGKKDGKSSIFVNSSSILSILSKKNSKCNYHQTLLSLHPSIISDGLSDKKKHSICMWFRYAPP